MRKIIDCFTFFNELDILEIRLKYLYDSVDYFVIVESNYTFSGNSKKYHLENALVRFKPYIAKIIYVKCNMDHLNNPKTSAWNREHYQRNYIKSGLDELNLESSDFVLIGDVDEIPDNKILSSLNDYNQLNKLIKQESIIIALTRNIYGILTKWLKLQTANTQNLSITLLSITKKLPIPINLQMMPCVYYVNYQQKATNWDATQIVTYHWFNYITPNQIRNFRLTRVKTIQNAGWHLTYLGGVENIKHKLKNFAHQEFNNPNFLDDNYIRKCIKDGKSIVDSSSYNYKDKPLSLVSINSFPQKLHEILNSYSQFIKHNIDN